MQQYLELVNHLLKQGHEKSDRTGVGTLSYFGYQMRFDLEKAFPLLTTKKVAFSLVKSELLWFLRGDTNIKYLLEHNNHIWDEWAFEGYIKSPAYQGPDMTDFGHRCLQDQEFNTIYQAELKKFQDKILSDPEFAAQFGDLGPIYGQQWRSWQTADSQTVDQIGQLIQSLKSNPDSRRHIVTAWNPSQVEQAALPPCHCFYQFYVHQGKLSCQLYQRSADVFLGVPFNIASYALLVHLIALECDLQVGEFVHTLGDAHLYLNHLDAAKQLLQRQPRPLPQLEIENFNGIDQLEPKQILLRGYDPHPAISAPIAV